MLDGSDVIGARVDVDGQLGTIRFHGAIPSTSGTSSTIWYGIEWDDPSRGKHSGNHNGIQYFTTTSPNSASFIKPSPKIKFGRPFLEAVTSKYIIDETNIEMGGWGGKTVEAIGFDKVKRKMKTLGHLHEINVAALQICRVNGGGDTAESLDMIREACVSLEELDLSRNLFKGVSDVGYLTQCMPKLEILRLGYCRLELDLDRIPNSAFGNIKVLVLNGINWGWKDVVSMGPYLPCLEDLSFGFQDGMCATLGGSNFSNGRHGFFPTLRSLNLESNGIHDWQDVSASLSQIPNLESLVLTNNPIENIIIHPDTFKTLKSITLSATTISSWKSLDTLNTLPNLVDLRIRRIPLLDSVKQYVQRTMLIARISSLTVLNGSAISSKERKEAELYYVNQVCLSDMQDPSFNDLHPRYEVLIKEYDITRPNPATIKPASSTLKDRLIQVKLVNMTNSKAVEKRIPGTMMMRNFRSLVAKVVGCALMSMTLKVVGQDGRVVDMDDELREVAFYGVENGDTIQVGVV
ncbi:hypothetical protein SmJEL517_g04732 [Synchytrium microbalum]|uniref:CAP-Gly domain-containing protein n=1 Tax=Synchytrium microbalum TaxID=1806994 RepID=A0A507BYY9_9FUNG|nr:uncharacterized protein SmJEL517_g04732 [Synchytrium microbalum]TPX32079.1 hypothetical protein SmJEL517_g04732 [Synchytrium microbalum]